MPDWISAAIPNSADLPGSLLVIKLVQAAVLGFAVAAVYFVTQRKTRTEAAPFVATLVLLCVLIAMVTRVIGDNVARAFSLAGALAIIRFRTVVEDTRDTAFVIAAVVVGMAVGSDMMAVALAGLPVVAVTAALLNVWGRGAESPSAATLAVRLGLGIDPESALAETLGKFLADYRLVSANTARQGAAMEFTYTVRLRAGTSGVALIGELNRVQGVQGIEWKETAKGESARG